IITSVTYHHSLPSPLSFPTRRSSDLFSLPVPVGNPWLIPRTADPQRLITCLRKMKHRLSDYGYEVSTGPLVWNRHKKQLSSRPRSEDHTSELQSRFDLVCRLLLEKKT